MCIRDSAIVSVLSYYSAVYGVLRFQAIRADLSNLKYWHIVLLATIASVLNGFGLNLAYYTQGVTSTAELLSKGAAMAVGDFLGCCIVVMLFNGVISAVRRIRS